MTGTLPPFSWVSPTDPGRTEIANYSRLLMPYLVESAQVLNAQQFLEGMRSIIWVRFWPSHERRSGDRAQLKLIPQQTGLDALANPTFAAGAT